MLTVVDDMGETVLVGNSNSFLSSIKPSVKKVIQIKKWRQKLEQRVSEISCLEFSTHHFWNQEKKIDI